MTDIQVKLVRRSWNIFRQIDHSLVADVFYSRLFSIRPAYRRLFPADMQEQYFKLMKMMTHLVAHLDCVDEVAADITSMAKRHVGYGVKPVDYTMVGDALIWTLEKGLGNDWSDPLRDAWLACYQLLSEKMTLAAGKTA